MLVHLPGEPACELDRLDVGAKCPAEDALEQPLDLALYRAQHTHAEPSSGTRSAVMGEARRLMERGLRRGRV